MTSKIVNTLLSRSCKNFKFFKNMIENTQLWSLPSWMGGWVDGKKHVPMIFLKFDCIVKEPFKN